MHITTSLFAIMCLCAKRFGLWRGDGDTLVHPAEPDFLTLHSAVYLKIKSGVDRDIFEVHCLAIMPEKIIPYVRDREADKDAPYATKFATFIKVVNDAKATGCSDIVIVEPWVIGDTYEEITESLSHLSGTGIGLQIVTAPKTPWNN